MRALAGAGREVSIDTSKAAVAEAALDAGAEIVNDVTAFVAEPELADLCADRGAASSSCTCRARPRTMQEGPTYDDVVDDVSAFLAERVEFAVGRGVAEDRIWVDPGIGFGKTLEHNLELLRRLGELRALGRPILVGTSRKSFIGKLTGRESAGRLGGTIASNVLALANGADVFRVHDVRRRAGGAGRRRGGPRAARVGRRRALRRREPTPKRAGASQVPAMEAGRNGPDSTVEVELRGLSIYTHHGVTDAEQEVGPASRDRRLVRRARSATRS